MAPAQSKFMHVEHMEEERRRRIEKIWPPPVPFNKPKKKKGKKGKASDDDEEDDTKTRSFNVPLDPNAGEDDDKETYTVKLSVFENGTPEDWCDWRRNIDDLFESLDCRETAKKIRIHRSLLIGKAAEEFMAAYNRRVTINVTDEAQLSHALEQILNDVALKLFPDGAGSARGQKRFMRNNLFIGNKDPEKFAERLVKMNNDLPYYPVEDVRMNNPPNHKLEWDELVDIMDYAKPIDWHISMLAQGKKPHTFNSLEEAVTYYKQLYDADVLKQKLGTDKPESRRDKKKRIKEKNKTKELDEAKPPAKCSICGKQHKGKCWFKDGQRPAKRGKFQPNFKGKKPDSKEVSHVMVDKKDFKKLVKNQQRSNNKRSRKDDSSESSMESFDNYLAGLKLSEDQANNQD